jgi:hypothetical protein
MSQYNVAGFWEGRKIRERETERKKRKKERRKEGALVVFSFLNKVWCVDQ